MMTAWCYDELKIWKVPFEQRDYQAQQTGYCLYICVLMEIHGSTNYQCYTKTQFLTQSAVPLDSLLSLRYSLSVFFLSAQVSMGFYQKYYIPSYLLLCLLVLPWHILDVKEVFPQTI